MVSVISISAWKDSGFQRDSYIVPKLNNQLRQPDRTYDFSSARMRPSTSDLFKSFRIQAPWSDFYNVSYLGITADIGTIEDFQFFAWVDSVEVISDSEIPVTQINYTIDLWRTYAANAVYGFGIVRNRPPSVADPIQNLSYRYRLPENPVSLIAGIATPDINWILISAQVKTVSQKLTGTRAMIFPVGDSPDQELYISNGVTTVKAPTLGDFMDGSWDEKLGLDPEAVNSVFLSPIPPLPIDRVEGTTIYIKTETAPSVDVVTKTGTMSNLQYIGWYFGSDNEVYDFRWNAYGEEYENPNVYTVNTFKSILAGYKGKLNSSQCSPNSGITGRIVKHQFKVVPQLQILYTTERFFWSGSFDDLAKILTDFDKNSDGAKLKISGNIYKVDSITSSCDELTSTSAVVNDKIVLQDILSSLEYTFSNGSFSEQIIVIYDAPVTYEWTYSKTSYAVDNEIVKIADTSYGYCFNKAGYFENHSGTLTAERQTTEKSELTITDMSGLPIGSIPWGLKIKDYGMRLIATPVSAAIEIRFRGVDSYASGLCFSIPLPSIDISSNAVSSYLLSGQRDYDMRQREIAAQQSLIQGVSGAATGAVGNAMLGGIGGLGASTVGIASAGLGIATSLVGYGLDLYQNGQLQKAEDQLKARQSESIISAGSGWDWLWHGRDISLIELVCDEYSISRYDKDIEFNGISCSEPTDDITQLMNKGGPLRISNAVILGDIPPEAKQYISQMLAKGVYMQ